VEPVIISSKHRFVFVELPRTGCTAVGEELISQYDGERILSKHSTYRDFLRIATDDEKRYFTFSGVRNPLDDAVSHYFTLKTDHHNRFTYPTRRRDRVGNRGAEKYRRTGTNMQGEKPHRRSLGELLDNRRFDYIRRHDADFARFFPRYHWLPCDNWSRLSHADMDFAIRFEHLRRDFAEALGLIGIEMTRLLPVLNKTSGRSRSYEHYYTPDVTARAKRVYGPFIKRWGYGYPPQWDDDGPSRWNNLVYNALAIPSTTYWRYLRTEE
jgi:hypothetical protein